MSQAIIENARIDGPTARAMRELGRTITSTIHYTICTSSTRPASPVEGDQIYETDKDRTWIWNGTTWIMTGGRIPGVRARLTAVQSVANATIVVKSWNSEDYDTDVSHDNATNNSRLTVPAGLGGLWTVGCSQYFASASSGVAASWFEINAGGSNGLTRYGYMQVANKNTDGVMLQHNDIVALAAGDYVENYVFQNSGGALDVGHTAIASFWMHRLGPS